jgi:hypothetical protein
MKTLQNKLKQARKNVNLLKFGTEEWENEMKNVRELCNKINAMTNNGIYKSIDGDVFSV